MQPVRRVPPPNKPACCTLLDCLSHIHWAQILAKIDVTEESEDQQASDRAGLNHIPVLRTEEQVLFVFLLFSPGVLSALCHTLSHHPVGISQMHFRYRLCNLYSQMLRLHAVSSTNLLDAGP